MRRVGRFALRTGVIVGALAILLTPAQGAARRGPPEGSAAWLRGQEVLSRPGAALAAARDAYERGDRLRAEWLLAETAVRHPLIEDHADRMRAELLVELGRPEEAIAFLTRTLEVHEGSLIEPELFAVLGEANAAVGAEQAARQAWREALDRSREDELRATLLLGVAQSEERSELLEDAIGTYTVLWYLYPLSPEAETASVRLAAFEEAGLEPRDAKTWRRRADRLYRKRRNKMALAAYDTALATGLSRSETTRVRKKRAQTLFRMRRYDDAVRAFAELSSSEDNRLWHARSLARAGQVPAAIAEFEKMSSNRRGRLSLRARLLAAILLDGQGENDRARRHLESLSAGVGASPVARASLWRLGWGAYREGRFEDCVGSLDKLIESERDAIGGLRTHYWRTRCLEGLGTPTALAEAHRELRSLANEYPLSYYGWRARLRIGDPSPAAADTAPESARDAPPGPGSRKLADRDLERARILVSAGLHDEAVEELHRASRTVGGLADRLELAQLFSSAGSYRGAQRLVVDPYKETLARGPRATLEELWWHAWPDAFAPMVKSATSAPGSVDPALVLSIMREESGFRPSVVSPVGARGLLQIMEPTGQRLALAIGYPDFSADDLFEPATNIRLGSFYLTELSQQFEGRLSAAIASYNAGPIVVSRWLEERPGDEDDEWVESIPYEQTRNYVKRVLRSLQAYRLLY